MLTLVSAVAFGLAAYLFIVRDQVQLSTEAVQRRKRRQASSSPRWSITVRSCKALGVSLRSLSVYSWISAVGMGALWFAIVGRPAAAVIIGYFGYQLPGFAIEWLAARFLDQLSKQASVFVGAVNDALGRGATTEEAMIAACQIIKSGPLYPTVQKYLKQTRAQISLQERVALLNREVDLPSLEFFKELIKLRTQTGVEEVGDALEVLNEKLNDDERQRAQMRSQVSMHMGLMAVFFGLNLVVFPGFRFLSPSWPTIQSSLWPLIDFNAAAIAGIFLNIRRFASARAIA